MSWIEHVLDRLATATSWRYLAGGSSSTEPAALAALALLAHDRANAAKPAFEWLATVQNGDGSLGIRAAETTPCWPSSLAVLAWQAAEREQGVDYRHRIENALAWILKTQGAVLVRTVEMGHDSTLAGWPWVEGTHSWIEPTSLALLALKATGHGGHARAREAVRLLLDRLLPNGGCNYGNTFVFGQLLLPHLQPTGISLLALAGENDPAGRIVKSIAYLRRELSGDTATASLCYGLLGLSAHGAIPLDSESWLAAAANRALAEEVSEYKLALLALAALGRRCPLVLPHRGTPVTVGCLADPMASDAMVQVQN